MINRELFLVHSDTPSARADDGRARWWLDNAKQGEFFEYPETVRVFLVPVLQVNPQMFRNILKSHAPRLIVDTRGISSFFSMYATNEGALVDFKARGIEYLRFRIHDSQSHEDNWFNWNKIKSVLHEFHTGGVGNNALFLTTTWQVHDNLLRRINGYLSQEPGHRNIEIFTADMERCVKREDDGLSDAPKIHLIR